MKLPIKNLQHVLTDHCNLRCNNCSSLSPLIPKHYSNIEQFKIDINKLSQIVEIDTFELVGGEPLLHKQIDEFLTIIKDSNICKKISVFTNGKYLPKMSDLFYELVDHIDISVYPNSKINYKKIKTFLDSKSTGYILNYKPKFMVVHKSEEFNNDVTEKIFSECKIAHVWKCALIKDGYYYKCNIPYFKNKHSGFDNKQDGVNIHSEEFPMNFYRYLKSNTPLESCKHCNGTSGDMAPHTQIKIIKRV